MRERVPRPRIHKEPDITEIAEWLEEEPREVRKLFAHIPRPLWQRHFEAVKHLEPEGKLDYLSKFIEARKSGLEEFKSSDEQFEKVKSDPEFGEQLQELLESRGETLGAGQTARVKRLQLAEGRTAAVKYLLTPTEKTLSAEGEHDMLWEVDTVTHIEEAERTMDAGERIRVPHPYFYYKNEKVQCYGMEEIRGNTIEQLVATDTPNTVAETERRDAVWSALRRRYSDPQEQKALYEELDRFVSAVHTVCLHGDIKLANMMVDEEGTFYLIDFGQSIDMKSMTDKTQESFDNLQTLERVQLGFCVRTLIRRLSRQEQEAA